MRLDRCSNGLSLHRHGVQTSYPSIDWVNMRSCVFSASVRGPMSDGGSAWSNFAKAALVVGAISVGLLITAVVIGVIWWNRHGQEFVSGVQDAMKQGQMEGQGIAEETCLERSIESIRSDRGIDMSLMVEKSLHLQGCLSTARVSPNFCMKVPRVSEFIASAKWKIEKCNDLKMNDNSCQSLFSIQQTYCDSPERRSKVDSPSNVN